MGKSFMSEEECRLLCKMYSNEKGILAGKLYSYQEECLKQIRLSQEYLHRKYAGKVFHITSFRPTNRTEDFSDAVFYEESNPNELYTLRVEKEDGSYIIKDNYYGKLLRETYDKGLEIYIRGKTAVPCTCKSSFSEIHGMEIGGGLSFADILSLGNQIGKSTMICVGRGHWREDTIDRLKTVLVQNAVYGSYRVMKCPDEQHCCLGDEQFHNCVKRSIRDKTVCQGRFNTFLTNETGEFA